MATKNIFAGVGARSEFVNLILSLSVMLTYLSYIVVDLRDITIR